MTISCCMCEPVETAPVPYGDDTHGAVTLLQRGMRARTAAVDGVMITHVGRSDCRTQCGPCRRWVRSLAQRHVLEQGRGQKHCETPNPCEQKQVQIETATRLHHAVTPRGYTTRLRPSDVQLGSQVCGCSLSRLGGLTDRVFAGPPSDVQKQKCFKPTEVSDGPIHCRVTCDRGGYRGRPHR